MNTKKGERLTVVYEARMYSSSYRFSAANGQRPTNFFYICRLNKGLA